MKGHEISYTLQMINIPNLVKIGPVILRPKKGGGGGGGSLDPNSPCDISL